MHVGVYVCCFIEYSKDILIKDVTNNFQFVQEYIEVRTYIRDRYHVACCAQLTDVQRHVEINSAGKLGETVATILFEII